MKKYIIVTVLLLMQSGIINHAEQHRIQSANYNLTNESQPIILKKVSQSSACIQWVDSVMDKLNLREKIGQLFIYTIAPLDTKHNLTLLNDAVKVYKVGGLLFSGGQMQTQASLTNRAQQMAKVPLLITFDGEWGLAMRLKGTPSFPRNMVLGCITNDSLIYQYGAEMARQCREIGVQVNFAPVADVNINPNNPVINTRSFGEDPTRVAQKVIAYGKGLESGNVLSVSKHFPGHGDTDTDSHHALPILPFDRQRLDSIELYPFDKAIRAGLSGMMVGHLYVPKLENKNNLPASLSRSIVHQLLTEELGFSGLIFTDALAMKGVSSNKNVCLQALQAGNDMVLSPRNLKDEIEAVLLAVQRGDMAESVIDAKCRKVLTYKYALGLEVEPRINLSGLSNRINTPQATALINELSLAAITVAKNQDYFLPLASDRDVVSTALLEVEGKTSFSPLKQRIAENTLLKSFKLTKGTTPQQRKLLLDSLSQYPNVLIAIGENKLDDYQPFFKELAVQYPKLPVAYLCFSASKTLLQIENAVTNAQSVIFAHTATNEVQKQVADILFAKGTATGRLSATLGNLFKVGAGVDISPKSEVHYEPEDLGISSITITQIDSIAKDGVEKGAYPGCQIVVLKDQNIVYQKSFGTFAGKGTTAVNDTVLYDLASLSKTTGTLLAVMKLYDKGMFNLSDKLSDHLSWLKGTDKENITIREVLLHQSGLPASIGFYQELIDKDSYKGRLYSNKRDSKYKVRIGNNLWANPDFKFIAGMTSATPTQECTIQVSENLWLNSSYREQMKKMIAEAPMKSKQYRYSDVGFLLIQYLVEQLSGMSIDRYLQKEFYQPMGLNKTTYQPRLKFDKKEIVPSANDKFFRKDVLQGFVHDETAALQGGIAGNAGLFSNAEEVARIYQMLLNGGKYNGREYLSEETCRLFTTETSKVSRRGLGFDKPEPNTTKTSPCSASTPLVTFGHTGFTGTCVWADPENNLVYVFLSNRIYPDVLNRKLMQLDIRPKIQEAIYNAIIDEK